MRDRCAGPGAAGVARLLHFRRSLPAPFSITSGQVAKRKSAVRLVVGRDFGPRSFVWRIWSHKDELYVAPRSLAGTIKTSLHSGGLSRHAFTMETTSQFVPDGDRAWFKWNEPPEFARGARLVLEIVIPTDELTTPATEPSAADKTRIILIDPAPSSEATILSLVITQPDREVTDYPRPEGASWSALIASWAMPTRGTLWVVGSQQPLDEGFRELIKQSHQLVASAPQPPPSMGHPRAWIWLHDEPLALARYLDLSGKADLP
jgi:hypothetical protein